MVLVNSYTTGLSPAVMQYILGAVVNPRFGGAVSSDEIGLPGLCLPDGAALRSNGNLARACVPGMIESKDDNA